MDTKAAMYLLVGMVLLFVAWLFEHGSHLRSHPLAGVALYQAEFSTQATTATPDSKATTTHTTKANKKEF